MKYATRKKGLVISRILVYKIELQREGKEMFDVEKKIIDVSMRCQINCRFKREQCVSRSYLKSFCWWLWHLGS